jgi:hypothetical protein
LAGLNKSTTKTGMINAFAANKGIMVYGFIAAIKLSLICGYLRKRKSETPICFLAALLL